MEIGGASPPQFDRLNVNTSAALNGALRVRLIDGFVPEPGDEFTIMTCASRSGEFSTIDLDTAAVDFEVEYNVNNITLRAVGANPLGDLNCDGAFDLLDVAAFVQALVDPTGYESTHSNCAILNADLNSDGLVDGDDVPLFVSALLD